MKTLLEENSAPSTGLPLSPRRNLGAILSMVSCLLFSACKRAETEQPPPELHEVIEVCTQYSARALERVYSYKPETPQVFVTDFNNGLASAVEDLKLRYVPTFTSAQTEKFHSDFVDYLSKKYEPSSLCRIAIDHKIVIDFIDAFVLDNPGYLGTSVPTQPLGEYDEQRFATIPIWKNEVALQHMADTLWYGSSYSEWEADANFLPKKVGGLQVPILTYEEPSGRRFELVDTYWCVPTDHSNCPTILYGRTESDQEYTLNNGLQAARSFFEARGECAEFCSPN